MPADCATIKTQFVRDRLKETRWEDREYAGLLMGIERLIAQGGVENEAARLLCRRLLRCYPVEHGAAVTEQRRQAEMVRGREEQVGRTTEEKLSKERGQ